MPEARAETDLKQIGVQTDEKMRWLIDTSAVNVSLPYIAGNLSASVDEATWVLTSYLVANAIILPLSGWMANYFGRKHLLMMSVSGFSSWLAANSSTRFDWRPRCRLNLTCPSTRSLLSNFISSTKDKVPLLRGVRHGR